MTITDVILVGFALLGLGAAYSQIKSKGEEDDAG